MFKKSVSAKPNDLSNKSGGGEDEDLSDWKAVRLTFTPEHGKVRSLIKDSKLIQYDSMLGVPTSWVSKISC